MTHTPGLGPCTRALLSQAVTAFRADRRVSRLLHTHLERMDAPLRVAIAGKVKAGKSTLLNALVGEDVAATDAGECTEIVTWYQHGPTPRVTMDLDNDSSRALSVIRRDGALVIDLGGTPPRLVDRLVVDWPSRSLQSITLIDTPGIASINAEVSARTTTFLAPEDEAAPADAVIYLMRHLHSADVRFLEAFHDTKVARATPVNTIAVLSRADEIGGGRIDALVSARNIAHRYSHDERLRSLCQLVVPVAGLLAQSGRNLRRYEFTALEELANTTREDIDSLLLSADRFVRFSVGIPPNSVHSADIRMALLERFGLFGLRLGITLIRQGYHDPAEFSAELVRLSGFDELRKVLTTQFTERSELLKARSALLAVDRLLCEDTRPEAIRLRAEVERIMASAHELTELRLLSSLRSGAIPLQGELRAEAERLLGGQGSNLPARLGLSPEAGLWQCRKEALEALTRWRKRAESPLSDRTTMEASRVVVRSCEGLLAHLTF